MLVELVRRLIRRHRPARLVLGVPARDTGVSRTLRDLAERAARNLGVPAISRSVGATLRRLGFVARHGARNGLAQFLTTHFVPALRHEVTMSLNRLWHRRPAWHALALALHELVEVAPFAAAALAPATGHEVPSFNLALRRATAAV